MHNIALNFFPITTTQFETKIYRLPKNDQGRPKIGIERPILRSLEVDGNRDDYWTLFTHVDGSIETVCEPFTNVYVTIDALRLALIESCEVNLNASEFRLTSGFRRRVEITMATYQEGSQVIVLEPYLLRSRRKFGFLADFRFHPEEQYRGTRRALQLSLSLDKHGRANRNRYADKYLKLVDFVRRFHSRIFPLTLPEGYKVEVDSRLEKLTSERLDVKHYVVGSGSESKSQFMGVKQSGPLSGITNETRLCFLYRPEDRPLSHSLFRALRGDTFQTFPGMEAMFQHSINNEHVSGIPISNFSYEEIQRIADRVVAEANGSNLVPIILTPFSRHDELEDNRQYWPLKHAFLTRNLPLQVVATTTVADRNKLKWSVAGIGLQVFAKAGGTPWKVRPRTERCLIVGIGQAHQVTDTGIDRYFAYSVLTDSSGGFEEVRTLGESQNEEHYLQTFSKSLREIFNEYSDRFSSFVIHATFSIRRKELETIANVLSEHHSHCAGGEFVALKFNEYSRFFGFAVGHNSRVPYESSLVRLARSTFLVWFEGLQYGGRTVNKLLSNPVYVQFTYPYEGISPDRQRAYLQDAINLSGANWRGFNAKSLPVSVYYAQLIARYLKEFRSLGLPVPDVNTLTPWFL